MPRKERWKCNFPCPFKNRPIKQASIRRAWWFKGRLHFKTFFCCLRKKCNRLWKCTLTKYLQTHAHVRAWVIWIQHQIHMYILHCIVWVFLFSHPPFHHLHYALGIFLSLFFGYFSNFHLMLGTKSLRCVVSLVDFCFAIYVLWGDF